jgi:hypothetical protein
MLSGKRTISTAVLRKLSYLLQRESAVLMERAAIAKRISNEIDAQLKEDA